MKLFISYSRDDKTWVYDFTNALREDGEHDAWIDRRIAPSTDWWDTILANIEEAQCFVFVMSPKSVDSIYCLAELDYALKLNKPILPVLLKPCPYPPPLHERRIQYLTITEGMSTERVLLKIEQGLREVGIGLVAGKYAPNKVRRPPLPEAKGGEIQTVTLFQEAEDAVIENNLPRAVQLFEQIIDADPDGMGAAASERLTEIRRDVERQRDYQAVLILRADPRYEKGALAAWRAYKQKYGTSYDPQGLSFFFPDSSASPAPTAPPDSAPPKPAASQKSAPPTAEPAMRRDAASPPAAAPKKPAPVSSEPPSTAIRVVGVGNAGGNILNREWLRAVDGVKLETIAVNTDNQALQLSRSRIRLRIGDKLTRGLGSGGNPEIGRKAAEESADDLYEVLRGSDIVIIVAGMGGGTGSGASPIIAQIAYELGALVFAVVSLPFTFEGTRRKTTAEATLDTLKRYVNAIIVMPNDHILQLADKRSSLQQAFSLADDSTILLTQALLFLGDFGFADLMAIFRSGDKTRKQLFIGFGEDKKDVGQAVRAALDGLSRWMLDLPADSEVFAFASVPGGDPSAAAVAANAISARADIFPTPPSLRWITHPESASPAYQVAILVLSP